MKSKQVIIELQSDRIDVVVYDAGKPTKFRRVKVSLDSEPEKWIEDVLLAGAELKKVVIEMGLTGQSAIVLYSGPTQVVEMAGFEVKSTRVAQDAAQLRCIESLPFASLSAVCQASCLGRDSRGMHRKMHTLAVADREDILEAILEMVRQACLVFEYATPIAAVIMRKISLLAMAGTEPCQGQLYIGERHSHFVIAHHGCIVFSRLINIGLDALARSLTRPIKNDQSGEIVEFDEVKARKVLYAFGIPKPDSVIQEDHGVTAHQIIPLLQPVLQRLIVELRQSLRFSLDEKQRQKLKLTMRGPGCALSGLSQYISEELQSTHKDDGEYKHYQYDEPGSPGSEQADAVNDLKQIIGLKLQPKSHVHAGRAHRLRQWIWAGAAAALVMIALDGIGYQIRVDGAQMRMDAISGLSEQFEQLQRSGQKLSDALQSMHGLERAVIREMGTQPDFSAALHELTDLTPATIGFTKITFRMMEGIPIVSLSGFAYRPDSGSGTIELEEFMESLRSSPLFDQVKLITVQSGQFGNRYGQAFEARSIMIAMPESDIWSQYAVATEGVE